jgi:hypothetical protein
MEVRNSALRSLCTNIVATGDRLTVAAWRTCAVDIMLPLMHDIGQRAGSADGAQPILGERLAVHSEERMTVHHSKDTEEKQWRETRVTALQGASKVVVGVVQRVGTYRELAWFRQVWLRLLQGVDKAVCAPGSPRDVVAAGVAVWEELALLASGAGARTRYAVPGMKVVNGSLAREQVSASSAAREDLWPDLVALFPRACAALALLHDADTGALLFNAAGELFAAKDCAVVRRQDFCDVLCDCAVRAVAAMARPGAKFVSPLERAVLQMFRRLPPLGAQVWPKVLRTLQQFGARPGEGDDFESKAGHVFLELFGQADAATRAGVFVDMLAQQPAAAMPAEVLAKGLEALPGSGMPSFTQEDVWMRALELQGAAADFEFCLGLMRRGLVPLAVRAAVADRVAANPGALLAMIELCGEVEGEQADAELVQVVLPALLPALHGALKSPGASASIVASVVDARIPGLQMCAQASALAQRVARDGGPALVAQELDAFLELAVGAQDPDVRELTCKGLRALVMQGWGL